MKASSTASPICSRWWVESGDRGIKRRGVASSSGRQWVLLPQLLHFDAGATLLPCCSSRTMAGRIYIGTAGWSIPKAAATRCPGAGSHLERYARTFQGTEINSSFYRPHTASTYAKWAASTNSEFRFAVKYRERSPTSRSCAGRALPCCASSRRRAASEFAGAHYSCSFHRRLPSTRESPHDSSLCFGRSTDGPVVCEPRHPTWFSSAGHAVLCRYEVARVAADPPPMGATTSPGGWDGIAYFRLHGSPRMYWSRYDPSCLTRLCAILRRTSASADVWCVFDNTASGAALDNAWELQSLLR